MQILIQKFIEETIVINSNIDMKESQQPLSNKQNSFGIDHTKLAKACKINVHRVLVEKLLTLSYNGPYLKANARTTMG